ncbi:AAA family ATPase [Sphingomonas colocasiae]|uniref:AAA family ATPase n=1 Tax=Sphingomonas colocasiae TaxID=1848973 RepID=A0ABS7PIL4_9SPHN|nr:AAA family ATPase [Sphingomonas colocasiae]MBY8821088.1 AAA family ATPase [Sphingomonas colocasiae]
MKISRINQLRDLAVFHRYAPAATEADFCKLNLIYGFNGSGKTTLSRLFASMERGALSKDLPVGGRFEFALEGGTVVAHDANLDRLKGQIAVFNEDFVETNFRWREGSANPVFFLGEEQAGLADELRQTQEKQEPARVDHDQRKRDRAKAETVFANFKRDTARNIAEQFGFGRSYIATQLDRDYSREAPRLKLEDTEQSSQRAILAQTAPKPKIERITPPEFNSEEFRNRLIDCLSASVGAITLAEFQRHEEMLRWAQEGLEFHRSHDLATCLFCGNGLSRDRLAQLDAAIDDRLGRISAEAQALLDEGRTQRDVLLGLSGRMPSENDVVEGQNILLQHRNSAEKAIGLAREVLAKALGQLEQKVRQPNGRLEMPVSATDMASFGDDRGFQAAIAGINQIIDKHNMATDQFEARRQAALDRLKDHYLSLSETRYRELERSLSQAITAETKAEATVRALNEQVIDLRGKLLQHGPAATAINALVKAYLRHGNIEIVAAPADAEGAEGFQIRRNGSEIVGVLSEGEKTAIALCYFISTLSAEGRKIRDLIVVVDDPISSLDTKALNYAFTLLKSHLSGAKQVFLLTHNIYFMQECRKWLLNMSKKEPPTAALLFIEITQDESGKRTSRIDKLPKLLRDYESEYHYLFQHLKNFAASEGLAYDHFYLMPNAMRKVLDIFLAFKLPGPDGLRSKVERLAETLTSFDGNRLMALDRLVQWESHADNLDDLVSFSSMTIEEARDSANAILALMVEMDRPHHDRLMHLCA